jgi:hypothetical protein
LAKRKFPGVVVGGQTAYTGPQLTQYLVDAWLNQPVNLIFSSGEYQTLPSGGYTVYPASGLENDWLTGGNNGGTWLNNSGPTW